MADSQPRVVKELEAIKRLLMLQLIASGVQANDIALALGVNKSVISEILPVRKLHCAKKGGA
jgi:predicted transcriptional regulator